MTKKIRIVLDAIPTLDLRPSTPLRLPKAAAIAERSVSEAARMDRDSMRRDSQAVRRKLQHAG